VVKLLRPRQKQLVFDVSQEEKDLLFKILRLYPLVPPMQHRLSKTAATGQLDEHQRLLEELLASHRAENRKNILALLDEPGRFQTTPTGFTFKITRPETDWLLQVLNDVRIGSWIALGSPDTEAGEEIPLNEETAPYLRSMEIAGAFETVLLDALTGRHTSWQPT